ncbi:MAG: 6-phosphofructo-2-kinase/fructose-2,6-bisphosphatase [Desulfovibrio sp.]|nr:6-phosphofructo-2-kinase/fructose-2,6-bisphosphatase [Desulfovibrio sp.]
MHKLYVVMVGLPARGKSTLAKRICGGLKEEGVEAKIFNNGELRRILYGANSTDADFYNPSDLDHKKAREQIALRNLARAKAWINNQGMVAVLDATNASRERRRIITQTLSDHPILFVECVNEDTMLQDICIARKTSLPEFANYTKEDALANFLKRIHYYESIFEPLSEEKYWLRVDSTANRILEERALDGSPYYPAIRQILVDIPAEDLYLARHGETEFNLEGRIGGDPLLTPKGLSQATALATHLRHTRLDWVFTSTRRRSHQTAAPVLQDRHDVHTLAMPEFDELWAGSCEGMRYAEIREKMPEVSKGRNANKYNYSYPNGESYRMLHNRVKKGLCRALFLAGGSPILIIGHQAINRVLLSLFLRCHEEDIPYIFIPQNEFYHISVSLRRKVFERIPYN